MIMTGFLLAMLAATQADPPALPKRSFVYKEVGGVKIELDVHRDGGTQPRPVLVWIHGGALIMGNRSSVPRDLLYLCRDAKLALVSIDYRLAPQVKLPDIISDVQDALAWIREKGPELAQLNPKKLVVAGGSAGGYLTLMTGIGPEPRPLGLVAYWGYGDVDGDWYTKPSEFYRTKPIVDPKEAFKALSPAQVTAPPDKEQAEARSRYYLALRQHGLWTREVTGFEPGKDKAKLDPYCPVRNVTPTFPPTVLIHGTVDTDVPFDLSAAMAKEFERNQVYFDFIRVPDAGHGLSGGDKRIVYDAHNRARVFIQQKLK